MRAILLLLAAVCAFGQSGPLSPIAQFDLDAGLKHRPSRHTQSFLGVTPKGLTLVTVDEHASIVSADLKGNILHTTPDVTSVGAQIFRALPLPDGRVWVVAQGPYLPSWQGCCYGPPAEVNVSRSPGPTFTRPYEELDLYRADGGHLSAVRLRTVQLGPPLPIAAAADMVVALDWLGPGPPAVIRIGTVATELSTRVDPFRSIPPSTISSRC